MNQQNYREHRKQNVKNSIDRVSKQLLMLKKLEELEKRLAKIEEKRLKVTK